MLKKPKILQIMKLNLSRYHPNYQKKYPNIGGPKNAELLFSVEEFKESFINYDFLELQEVETSLNEGEKHVGKGSVVRMFAKKKL